MVKNETFICISVGIEFYLFFFILATVISLDSAALLQCIIDIIYTLWNILETATDGPDNVNFHKNIHFTLNFVGNVYRICFQVSWMRSKFANLINNRFITNRFPYATHKVREQKSKKKKDSEFTLSNLKSDCSDPNCYVLNLSLSKLILNFSVESKWKIIINYLKRMFSKIYFIFKI